MLAQEGIRDMLIILFSKLFICMELGLWNAMEIDRFFKPDL